MSGFNIPKRIPAISVWVLDNGGDAGISCAAVDEVTTAGIGDHSASCETQRPGLCS